MIFLELNKNKKVYLHLLLIIILSIFTFQKYEKREDMKKNQTALINEKNELDKKLKIIYESKIKKQKISEKQLDKLNNIILSLNINTLKSETEFKKMIYLFSEKSNLYLKEIGKAETIWEKGNYSLKYIFFTFEGDLMGITNFLYLINKNVLYIDMSKSFIELTRDSFKISLGYLENNEQEERKEKND